MTQDDLFSRPTREGGRETSREAAKTTIEDLRESQAEVLLLLLDRGPATDPEILDQAGRAGFQQSPSGLRTRRSELVERGLVEDTGERRETRFGNEATVWALTKPGRFLAADVRSRWNHDEGRVDDG